MKKTQLASQLFWTSCLLLSLLFSILSASRIAVKSQTLTEAWDSKIGEDGITIMLTGDIMLGRYIDTLMIRNGGDFPFTYMPDLIAKAKELLSVNNLDLIAGNLEGPITAKQTYFSDMIFRFKPETADLLKRVGFTTLNLANNHIFNQTRAGYTETVNYLSNVGITPFGEPDTENGTYSFTKYDFPEGSVGFLGLDDVDFKISEPAVLQKIAELDKQVDTLIISIHWGTEYVKTASPSITALAHSFVDSGADMIWGHHPHVVQNSEIYNGAPIYYSLGNFVFDQYWSAETQKGLVLAVKIMGGQIQVAEIPINIINMGEPVWDIQSNTKH